MEAVVSTVVEDFMIAANVAAAKALESKVAPVVYRIHEPPSREKLVALKDYLSTFDRKLALGQVITPSLSGTVRAAAIYRDQRFSDHAPLTLDYDYVF